MSMPRLVYNTTRSILITTAHMPETVITLPDDSGNIIIDILNTLMYAYGKHALSTVSHDQLY